MMANEQRNEHRGGGGYYVRRPRATDALGESLRHAFGETGRLPEEFMRPLRALDRISPRH